MDNLTENIRLIIWDLDETFWKGTLTEGGIEHISRNELLIKHLSERGIINAICSKNDKKEINKVLKSRDLDEYFVFNSINWFPKADRVKQIIDNIGLRPESVLFIDDNVQNLNQVKALVPMINVSLPSIIPEIKENPFFAGKDDSQLSRLKQYKINEKKSYEQESYVSNIDFLKESNVEVIFDFDVEENIDRAIELINRTNQLNFTKKRLPENLNEARNELSKRLSTNTSYAGLVKAKDKYGDYGYVGFFLLRRVNKEYICEHFCFSCRIMNMFIEQWVYQELNQPKINIIKPVVSTLITSEPLCWINSKNESHLNLKGKLGNIFVRGGCDVASLTHYLSMHGKVTSEFNTVIDGIPQRIDHSNVFLLGISNTDTKFAEEIGYEVKEIQTKFSKHYDLYLFSFWADVDIPVYHCLKNNIHIPFWLTGAQNKDLHSDGVLLKRLSENVENKFVENFLNYFDKASFLNHDEMLANYSKVLEEIEDKSKVIFISANSKGRLYFKGNKTLNPNHEKYNNVLKSLQVRYPEIKIIDVNSIIQNESDIIDLNHFDRMTYYKIYKSIIEGSEVG